MVADLCNLEPAPTRNTTKVSDSYSIVEFPNGYFLKEWERNGYDDSDFFARYWDDEHGMVRDFMFGSTRYYGRDGYRFAEWTPEVWARYREAVAKDAGKDAVEKARRYAEEPEARELVAGKDGSRVRLTKGGTFKDRKTGAEIPYQAGDEGTVIWLGSYRRSYGRTLPRKDWTAGVALASGSVVFVPLTKVRRAETPDLDAVRAEAEERVQQNLAEMPGSPKAHKVA